VVGGVVGRPSGGLGGRVEEEAESPRRSGPECMMEGRKGGRTAGRKDEWKEGRKGSGPDVQPVWRLRGMSSQF
jgi:hypothetical protein